MARIFLVEDDSAVRAQLKLLFEGAGHQVSCPDNFDNVAQQACANPYELVVLDLGLPKTDGQYIAREIRENSSLPILILTSRSSELDELMSLTFGADDFVPKSTSPQLILARVEALLRRTQKSSVTHELSWNGVVLDVVRSAIQVNSQRKELTKNELRILELLMRREGAIVSREELMEALWATDSFVDDNTLTVNMNRLRQTLSKTGVHDYIVTHRGQGYSLRMPS